MNKTFYKFDDYFLTAEKLSKYHPEVDISSLDKVELFVDNSQEATIESRSRFLNLLTGIVENVFVWHQKTKDDKGNEYVLVWRFEVESAKGADVADDELQWDNQSNIDHAFELGE